MSFLDLVKARYSVRSYEQRIIEPEKLEYIMECTRLAPSAVNLQPCVREAPEYECVPAVSANI